VEVIAVERSAVPLRPNEIHGAHAGQV
jgi:hypothetical protein